MTLDFFVLPELPSTIALSGISMTETDEFQEYLVKLRQARFSAGKNAYVIGTKSNFSEQLGIDDDHIIRNYMGARRPRGLVNPNEIGKLRDIVSNHDDSPINIHGAYFGVQTFDFAAELYVVKSHYELFNGTVPNKEEQQINAFNYAVENGLVAESPIKYGVVFESFAEPAKIRQPNRGIFWTGWLANKHGNANYQLIGEQTTRIKDPRSRIDDQALIETLRTIDEANTCY